MTSMAIPTDDIAKDTPQKKQRFFNFDVIRAIATLMIILFHFDIEIIAKYPTAVTVWAKQVFSQSFGDIGVTLFIILSGVTLMIGSDKNKFSISNFYKKRILAIYPSFWIAYLAIACAILIVGQSLPGDGHYWKIILTFIGLDGFFLYRMSNYYLVGEWFTGFILIMYTVFPLLRVGLLKKALLSWFIVGIIATTTSFFYSKLFLIPEKWNPLTRMPDFFFGMFFMRYIISNNKVYTRLFAVCAVLTTLFCLWRPPVSEQLFIFVSGITIFVTGSFLFQKVYVPQLVNRAIGFLSKYSFLAFLLHHKIIYFFSPRINAENLNKAEVILYFLGVVFISYAGAFLLEKPVKKLTDYVSHFLFKNNKISQPA